MAATKKTNEFAQVCEQGNIEKIKEYVENGGRLNFVKNGQSPFEIVLSSNMKESIEALRYLTKKTVVFPEVFDILRTLAKNDHKIEKYKVLSEELPQLFFCTSIHQHLKQMLILLEYELTNSKESALFEKYYRDFSNRMTDEDKTHFAFLSVEKVDDMYVRLLSKQKHADLTKKLTQPYLAVLKILSEVLNHQTELSSAYTNDFSRIYQRLLFLPKPLYDQKKSFERQLFQESILIPTEYLSKLNLFDIEPERFLEFANNKCLTEHWTVNLLRYALTNQKLYDTMKPYLRENVVSFDRSHYSIDSFFMDVDGAALSDQDKVELKFNAAQAMANGNFKLLEFKQSHKKIKLNF